MSEGAALSERSLYAELLSPVFRRRSVAILAVDLVLWYDFLAVWPPLPQLAGDLGRVALLPWAIRLLGWRLVGGPSPSTIGWAPGVRPARAGGQDEL